MRSAPKTAPKRVSILGATGSIGRSTIDLIQRNPAAYDVIALTANSSVDALAEAATSTGATFAAIADPECYADLRAALSGTGIEVAAGPEALIEAALMPADWTMAAIVGAAGLAPTLAAAGQGAAVALANKEALVCASWLIQNAVKASGGRLLPVDSEHNAIFQALCSGPNQAVRRIILTASGGPFRTWSLAQMAKATPEEAVKHPRWSMGAKISVDSATMMNKGLELIEAHLLFDLVETQLDVLVHPQSVVHGIVEYQDGSQIAQLGPTDMRVPIAHTLAWPDRLQLDDQRLDLAATGRLDFEPADPVRFPALRVAREALRAGAGAPNVLNAANEVAVAAFLDRRLGFLDIVAVVEATLAGVDTAACGSLEAVLALDSEARKRAMAEVSSRATRLS